MTKRECAIVMAYTGTCMLSGYDLKYFYEYLSEIVGRPVYTHEMVTVCKSYALRIEGDFRKLCEEAIE